MAIQIDKDLFLPEIKTYAANNKPQYQDQCVDLSYDVLDMAQSWFDLEPWTFGRPQDYDTMRECRISMKRYIAQNIDFKDRSKGYNLIPGFVFQWVAGYLITFIVKKLVEWYWDDLVEEMGLDF